MDKDQLKADSALKDLLQRIKTLNDPECQSIKDGDIFLKFGTNVKDKLNNNSDFSFIKKLVFDKNSKYLIGYGENKFFILNLLNKQIQF